MTPIDTAICDEGIIFVTGYARTGTTLMQGLLCMSEDVMPVSAESVYLRGLIDAYWLGRTNWQSYNDDLFADRESFRRFHRAVLALYLTQVREHFATERRIVQKAPQHMAFFVAEIAELLPNARFVVMVRDPRDVIASQLRRLKRVSLRLNLPHELAGYVELYSRLAAPSLAGRVAIVRYEQLVAHAVPVMAEVGAFLGIRLPADVASSAWESKRLRADATWSALDGRPISAARVAAHKGVLAPPQLAAIERARAKIERRLGFPVYFDKAPESAAGAVMLR